jgi:hypothetical protein
VGAPKKKTPPFPIVEILGPPDIGKSQLAYLVAKRLNGNHLALPVLDPSSSTGSLLLANLTTNMQLLEKIPQWWAHIYMANTFEQKERIEALKKVGPVILTNYVASFRVYNRSIEASSNLAGYAAGLQEPDYIFQVQGPEWANRPSNLLLDYTPEVRNKLKRSFMNARVPKATKVSFNTTLNSKTQQLNLLAIEISEIVSRKSKIPLNLEMLYQKNQFDILK